MILSFWMTILSWFVPVAIYLFRCIVCALEQKLTLEAAKATGWKYSGAGESKGWRCNKCA